MKKIKEVISAALVCVFSFASFSMVFAQADPIENVLIKSLSETSDWMGSSVKSSGLVSGTRKVIDFSELEPSDKAHGEVLKYTYAPGATMGGVVMYEEVFNHKSPDKKLSFDFYVYDNTIPYEIRLICAERPVSNTKVISQFNINYSDYKITTPNSDAKIGILDGGSLSNAEKATKNVSNKEWHKMEVIINAEQADYYIDGEFIVTSYAPDDTCAADFNSFSGVQVVSRADRQADSVTDESGLYLDNIKIYAYDENSAFYGQAITNDTEIVVELSESIHSESPLELSEIRVINTKTAEEAELGEITIDGVDKLVIPVISELVANDEYLIIMPSNLLGISKKAVHRNCYFSVSADSENYMDEGFDSYDLLTDNTTDICTPSVLSYEENGVNIKDSGESYGNVLFSGFSPSNHTVKFGITNGDDVIDISKGETTVEFDMKLVNNNYERLYMQPYSTMDGVDDVTLTDISIDTNNSVITNYPSQFCTLTVTSARVDSGSPTIQMRKTSNHVVGAHLNPHGAYATKPMSNGEWHTIKISIDYSTGDYPTVKTYIDDALIAQNTADLRGNGATNYLRGLRFFVVSNQNQNAEEYFYIDNVRFSGPASNAVVKKIRMYNQDGESFGPMASDNLKASADRAEIYFGEDVDTSEAFVCLEGGSDCIIGNVSEFDSENKKITVTFDEPMQKETAYDLTVTGVKSESGMPVPEYSARFETNAVGEFLITDLKFADYFGNTIESTEGLGVGDTLYVNAKIINTLDEKKTALVLATEYNLITMTNADYKAFEIPAGTKLLVENEISLEVKSLKDLTINGCVWEGFGSNLPLADSIEISN